MIMSERQVRRLPVVDRDKRLVGIVALGDFAVECSEIRPAAQTLSEISSPSVLQRTDRDPPGEDNRGSNR
jgi:CBS domain-containing protein